MKPPQFNHPSTTNEGKIERAVAVLNDRCGFVGDKLAFLKFKGLTDTEMLEALNLATNGELLRATRLAAFLYSKEDVARMKKADGLASPKYQS